MFSAVPSARSRGNRHKLKREALSEHQEMLLHCAGDGALAQVARRGCGVSLFGGLQELT